MSDDSPIAWQGGELLLGEVHLHYERGGTGPPVLLLHGLTDSGTTWMQVARALAISHEVVILDQRGHGRSSAPHTGYRIQDFVDDAAGVITALDIAPTAVVGHSLGGLIGLYLAAAHPYLVSRLVLEDPPLLSDWLVEGNSPEEVDAARAAWFASVVELRTMSPDERMRHIQDRAPGWTDRAYEDWIDSKMRMSPRLWNPGGVDLRGNWQAALRRVHCPLLLIRGDPERGSLVDAAREMEVLALVHDARSAHIPGASHSVHRDAFPEFMSTLAPFLDEGAGSTVRVTPIEPSKS